MNLEDQLCLLLAQGELLSPAKEKVLSLLAQPLRWDRILKRAQEHQVYPLVYRNLKHLSFLGAPAAERTELEALFRMNALRNGLLAGELATILQTLHQAGIPVIPLKGAYLSQALYRNINLRVYTDLDILVPRGCVNQVFDLLVRSGYATEFPSWFLTGRMMRNSYECVFWRKERQMGFLVELHWALFPEANLNDASMNDLWAEAQPSTFLDCPVYLLSAEWQLLFLAVHAARHYSQSLKWLVDIHEVCRRGGIDWEKVAAKARLMGCQRLLRWSLSVCSALLETPVPRDLSPKLPPPRMKLYPAPPGVLTRWHGVLLLFGLECRPSDKIRLVLRRLLVPTPADAALCRLPSSLAFLYYLLRPLRLAYLLSRSLLSSAQRCVNRGKSAVSKL